MFLWYLTSGTVSTLKDSRYRTFDTGIAPTAMELHYSFLVDGYADAIAPVRKPEQGKGRILKARDPQMTAMAKRIHASDSFSFEAACKAVDDATTKAKARE